MTDNAPNPPGRKKAERRDHTQELNKAIEKISSGDTVDGTLVDIEAHSVDQPGQRKPILPQKARKQDTAVGENLKKARRKGPDTPDLAPAATMYEPTRPGQVRPGSNMATQLGPTTGEDSPSMTPSASGGAGVVAPFGGRIMVGTRVGQIEVTGVLGKGGMGEVFKGYHHALDINVAVKVLPDELSRNDLVRQRFLREARLCVKLDHPHIVRVYNVDEHAGNLFLVMEMIEGTDAANMLKNGGRFKYKRALDIGAACADALSYAQSQGLVHRDVKPHNILLGREDGKIKLSDFGLARAATSNSHLTMSGQIMGTPHYMSPEQAEAKEVTDKSDVYSLGVTLYHMLTGETPFVGDTPISVAVQHIAKDILFPEARFKPFPKELVAVLKRMTAKDQAKRCSAKQAAVWLRKLASMATDDIQAPADIGATLAPVVRESAAFEAAAKERENRDEQAREQARTMLATVRESRRPSTQVATAPAVETSQYQVLPEKRGGAGKWVAVLLVLLLLGGGGAAWYLEFGGKEFVQSQGWIAGPAPEGNSGNGGDGGPVNPPPVNGSGSGGTTPLPPPVDPPVTPPEQDNEIIAGWLAGLSSALADNNLDEAEARVGQIRGDLQRASSSQREKFAELVAIFDGQHALRRAREALDRIATGVHAFNERRATDQVAAIRELNRAILAREDLEALTIPENVAPQIADSRELRLRELKTAYDSVVSELRSEIDALKKAEQLEDAEARLGVLVELRMPPNELSGVRLERQEVRTRDRHVRAYSQIRDRAFDAAKATIEDLERIIVPPSMREAHDRVKAALQEGINKAFEEYMTEAAEAAGMHDYAAAQAAYERARKLPDLGTEQNIRFTIERHSARVNHQLHLFDVALEELDFAAALKAWRESERLITEFNQSEELSLPEAVVERQQLAQQKFESKRSDRLDELLTGAEADLSERQFSEAAAKIAAADKLPELPDEQRARLEAFKEGSRAQLASYVRSLVQQIADALDRGDFAAATTALSETDALRVPDDMKETLESLQARFKTEAVSRHGTALAEARRAIGQKRYAAAREQIDVAAAIPVDDPLPSERATVEQEWEAAVNADVATRIEGAINQVDAGEFAASRRAITEAEKIALTDDASGAVANALRTWDERLDGHLSDLLEQARVAWDADNFEGADLKLAEAEKLREILSEDRRRKLADAVAARAAAWEAHVNRLFDDLEECVQRGGTEDMEKGAEIITRLEGYYLSPGRQARLNELRRALTGESPAERLARLRESAEHLTTFWENRYTKVEQHILVGEEITTVFATSDGGWGMVGTRSGKVFFYNLQRGRPRGSSPAGSRRVTSVAISEDGSIAVSGNDAGDLTLYDLSEGSALAAPLGRADDTVTGLAFSPNGRVLYVLDRSGNVTRFNPQTKDRLDSFRSGISSAQVLAVSSDGRLLAVGGASGKVAVFDAESKLIRKTLVVPGGRQVEAVSFSSDVQYLVAGSTGEGVAMWPVATLPDKPSAHYKNLTNNVRAVGFSPDSLCVVGFDANNRVAVWNRETATDIRLVGYNNLRRDREEFVVSAGWVSADGTGLMATRSGVLLHFKFGSGR